MTAPRTPVPALIGIRTVSDRVSHDDSSAPPENLPAGIPNLAGRRVGFEEG